MNDTTNLPPDVGGSRPRRASTAFAVVVTALLGWAAPVATVKAAGVNPLDRVQLHRNANRSVPYLPLAKQGQSAGKSKLSMRAVRTINLDGNPLQNVYANLRPIDVDGDGKFEFVHFNGYRFMQVWSASGRKLWRVSNSGGRLHSYREGTHRDTIAVLDLDGDGRSDIAHCWNQGGRKVLVYRRGRDGKVIRTARLEGGATEPCQIAAFRMATTRKTLLLVAHEWRGNPDCRGNHFVDTWARTVAFDTQQRKVWATKTCDAGHYAYPLDENYDGYVEGVFVGKHLLRPDGSIKCSLGSWPTGDHVDGMTIGELDPARAGLEVVAVGRTGLAMFDPDTCRQVWRISTNVIRDPQHVALAKLDPASSLPLIVVDERSTVRRAKTFMVNGKGKVVRTSRTRVMPMQNANLDGALGVDEKITGFGVVIDRYGAIRLGRSWYWNLRGNKTRETSRGPYPISYDRWQGFPLVFDYDRDGRDEIVQWGQSVIAIGKIN